MANDKWYSGISNIFNFGKLEENEPLVHQQSFVEPENIDAAVTIDDMGQPNAGGIYVHGYSLVEPIIRNTKDAIDQYRKLSNIFEVNRGIEEIVNEAIVCQSDTDFLIKLGLDSSGFSDQVKSQIYEAFEDVLRVYNFDNRAEDMFRQWYIDGRIAFHKIVDKDGKLIELRRLDPRFLEKVRIIKKSRNKQNIEIVVGYDEYFVYKPMPDDSQYTRYYNQRAPKNFEIRIPTQAIVFSHSGKYDEYGNIISYIHQSMKPANQLKSLEDAAVVYRLARAPERRIFYVDVGNLPKGKAEQHVKNIMNRFKNKVVYDPTSGKMKTGYDTQSMLEDYWLPRKEGSKSTEVSTLPGGSNLGNIEDIKYFRDNLYMSMNVPVARFDLERESNYQFTKPSEITREELRFGKFINKLQRKFSDVILEPLKTQVIAKKICTSEEWDYEINNIRIEFNTDSYYEEIKEQEILQGRVDLAASMKDGIGIYWSNDYVMHHALKMTDEEIAREGEKILQESKSGHPRFKQQSDY